MSVIQPPNEHIETSTPEEKVRIKMVAERLNSSVSTLNRYSRALENAGHSFTKNGNSRLYSSFDEELLAKMLQCTDPNQLGLSIELAASTVLHDENALDEKLNQIKKSQNEKEMTIRDFSRKLDELFSTLSANFITKNEMTQITTMIERIVEQDNHKIELIEKQNKTIEELSQLVHQSSKQTKDSKVIIEKQQELVERLEKEREHDKEQFAQAMQLYKDSEKRYEEAIGTIEWQQGKMNDVGKQLDTVNNKLDEMKQKKGFFGNLFKK